MTTRQHCPHCEQQRRSMRTDPTRCSHCQRPFPAASAEDAGPRCARCGEPMDPNASLFGGEQCTTCRVRGVRT